MNYLRYLESRPDQLSEMVDAAPVAYWPLGLLEHHSWHLPVGFDGIKAERMCERMADRTGGVILPVMWWGAGGGHGDFNWTLYQEPSAPAQILVTSVQKLVDFGFRVIVLLAGHYPWRSIFEDIVPGIRNRNPEVLILCGTEMEIAEGVSLPGDHAAREETSYGLALMPELIDTEVLEKNHSGHAWSAKGPPEVRIENLDYDPDSPCFAQLGADAREATAERGEDHVQSLVEAVTAQVRLFLSDNR